MVAPGGGDPGADLVPGILRAFNAYDLTDNTLWNSGDYNPDQDFVGTFSKFLPPVPVNNKVCEAQLS